MAHSGSSRRLRRLWADNSLSIVCFGLFFAFLLGQSLTGWDSHNQDQLTHGQATIGYLEYLTTGHFFEALFENWESEFLQMGAFVLLTAYLVQRGSAESKVPAGNNDVDADPRSVRAKNRAPWPVRRGGFWLKVYEHSLFIAFAVLFLASILGHALGGVRETNSEARNHGEPQESFVEYVTSSQFWFESFQNWQSEFLAVGAIVVLSVFLRERGSPESKPVAMPHEETPGS
jgi:hypothetical protein